MRALELLGVVHVFPARHGRSWMLSGRRVGYIDTGFGVRRIGKHIFTAMTNSSRCCTPYVASVVVSVASLFPGALRGCGDKIG